jgi:hypothetical protein
MAFMASASAPALTADQKTALDLLVSDLRNVFGTRLLSLVAYGLGRMTIGDPGLHSMALVERVDVEDLAACVPLVDGWQRHGLAVPLVLTTHEFHRTLDVFPLEYGDIIAHHELIVGADPFQGAYVEDADRRRACEFHAKSHLIHLREGFLERGADDRSLAQLIARSAPAFATLLRNIAILDGKRQSIADSTDSVELAAEAQRLIGVPAGLVAEVLATATSTIVDPRALLARYISASKQIWAYVDEWRRK